MTNTQTTAQTLAAGLEQVDQVLISLRDQRSGIIAKIVAGELPPAALDDHDEQIAQAVADAERRREIATAADAEAKRQQREASRQRDMDAIASVIDAHGSANQVCQQHHAAYIKAIEAAKASLSNLKSAQVKRAGLAQAYKEKCEAFEQQWPDEIQPKRQRLLDGGIVERAQLKIQTPSPSIYVTDDLLIDPTEVPA